MKLTPCSRARATMRAAVGSSVAPPNIMPPRHSRDTCRPLCPNVEYSITQLPLIACIELTPDAVEWPDVESQHRRPVAHRIRRTRGPRHAVLELPDHRH